MSLLLQGHVQPHQQKKLPHSGTGPTTFHISSWTQDTCSSNSGCLEITKESPCSTVPGVLPNYIQRSRKACKAVPLSSHISSIITEVVSPDRDDSEKTANLQWCIYTVTLTHMPWWRTSLTSHQSAKVLLDSYQVGHRYLKVGLTYWEWLLTGLFKSNSSFI